MSFEVPSYFIINKVRCPVHLKPVDNGWDITFGWNKALQEEVKTSLNGKWKGYDKTNPRKAWWVEDTARNRFVLSYLSGKNPYAIFDKPLVHWSTERPLYNHQKEMASQWYTRHYSILACEMGTGKSLAALEVCERLKRDGKILGPDHTWIWYIGPKTGISAIQREMRKWKFDLNPRCMTYQALVSFLKNWNPGDVPPQVVIFDESSYLKTPDSQRAKAGMLLAHAVLNEHGDNGWVTLMSGSPAPKSPLDWWNQAEIIAPGFLREGNWHKFRQSMGLFKEEESITGQKFPRLITWFDDPTKCRKCGMVKDHDQHKAFKMCPITCQMLPNPDYHEHIDSVNEVQRLYKRLFGLVLVKFKKDCLDLPEKQYQIIRVRPTVEIIRAAQLIKATTPRVASALILLRELSDGFQYTDEPDGHQNCPNCNGSKVETVRLPKWPIGDDGLMQRPDGPVPSSQWTDTDFDPQVQACSICEGTGKTIKYKRGIREVTTPKDDVLRDLLEDHEQYGRLVIWAGFTGSLEHIIKICLAAQWNVLRYDQQVQTYTINSVQVDSEEFLDAMDKSNPRYQELMDKWPRIVFVGNPKAGGMGLTLTSSPTAIYYSNDFSGEARIQSEDRIHRAGMDANRSCTIIDIIHLPTDELVLQNLKRKRELQAVTLGEVDAALKTVSDEYYDSNK